MYFPLIHTTMMKVFMLFVLFIFVVHADDTASRNQKPGNENTRLIALETKVEILTKTIREIIFSKTDQLLMALKNSSDTKLDSLEKKIVGMQENNKLKLLEASLTSKFDKMNERIVGTRSEVQGIKGKIQEITRKMDAGPMKTSVTKPYSVYFSVGRDVPTSWGPEGILNYQVERLNIGSAMNLGKGIFTAPRGGVYFFSFSGMAKFQERTSLDLVMTVNSVQDRKSRADFHGDNSNIYDNAGFYSILKLEKGDQVAMTFLVDMKGSRLEDWKHCQHTHFSGGLLLED